MGYRVNLKGVPGRPDIVYNGPKVAIFVNGCFWHRCPSCCLPLPKSNTAFWANKFHVNQRRDREKEALLRQTGWTVLTVWECAIERDAGIAAEAVAQLFDKPTRHSLRKVNAAHGPMTAPRSRPRSTPLRVARRLSFEHPQ